MAVGTVALQADPALAEEPPEAPRLGSGRAKPRSKATRWRSRSPVRRLDQSPDPPPPLLFTADGHEEGRRRGTAAVMAPAARSGEPAPGSGKLVRAVVGGGGRWRRAIRRHRCSTLPPDPPPPLLNATSRSAAAAAPCHHQSSSAADGELAAERGEEKPSRGREGRGEAVSHRRGEGRSWRAPPERGGISPAGWSRHRWRWRRGLEERVGRV
ncbi:hypothetical protein OsJ_32769 [Oryza sativa Japonica Group]|uniref:Uncharacterized protein n=1 Tax=Oryza sativa subsp. japonica TaxID=39947 RepID=B9G950_ORYSJ|nr:hypothetical protein OsJ_32769 [Oryza sativa Japonica Group]